MVHRKIVGNASTIVARVRLGPGVTVQRYSSFVVNPIADRRMPVPPVMILHVRRRINPKHRGKNSGR